MRIDIMYVYLRVIRKFEMVFENFLDIFWMLFLGIWSNVCNNVRKRILWEFYGEDLRGLDDLMMEII